jgi:hypothetical protein
MYILICGVHPILENEQLGSMNMREIMMKKFRFRTENPVDFHRIELKIFSENATKLLEKLLQISSKGRINGNAQISFIFV